jgi:type IV pilus assembly protein PilQ
VRPNPGAQYPANQFYDLVRASITAASTKVLASPTLILSENQETLPGGQAVVGQVGTSAGAASIGRPFANEAFVTVGTQVISSYTVQAGQNGAANTCQPAFANAGLTLGARVLKIDDNGFVTFVLSPAVSAATSRAEVPECGPVDILSLRRLDTGSIRVRDGQTLILAGVISDEDIQKVTKWPILGDMPLIGQFFRASSGGRRKNELVILVTPRIVDDLQGGSYGYGYTPATGESRRFMGGSM